MNTSNRSQYKNTRPPVPDPNDAGFYNNRGEVYLCEGKVDKAINDFNIAVKLQPELAVAYNNRGNAYLLKREVDKAIEDYSRSIKHAPKDAMSYSNRGVAYLRKGEFDKTIEDTSKAIALDEKLSNAYYNRAEAWLHLKEWNKAKADLTTAKKLGMDIVVAFHNLYRDVATFERRNSVKLPQDIVTMLRQYPINSLTTTQRVLTAEGKTQESYAVLELLEKFRNAGKPLSEYLHGQSSRGITTGCNEAFIVADATRDALIAEHPSSANVLKPFLMARDIQRWRVKPVDESRREPQDKWLIFTHRGIDINAYPAIKKHLGKYRDALENRSGKQEWYELQTAPTDTTRFTQPKCIYADMASETAFAFDDEGYYVGSPASLLPTSELWLLGVLNTRAVSWFYARTAPQIRGPFLKFVPRYVSQIPIPDMEPDQKALIHKIVEYILYLKKQPTVNSKDLKHARDAVMVGYFDRIIDGMVYESYLPDELHKGSKHFFQPLLDEQLPQLEEIQGDKMSAFRDIFEHLHERTYPIRINLFFLDSIKPIRIIESKA
ncbi:MAG: tetratricopeptide repeat protein [Candidatus Poribacteria bacterium]|nr:tetratricopeptide repeat protein [Candidatus Poribacteria bacterium]